MIVALLISIIGLVIGSLVMILANICDWEDWIFEAGSITAMIFGIAMMVLALHISGVRKQNRPKEYPASEYTFKIKVVEFEEQRDTILVIIPKEK